MAYQIKLVEVPEISIENSTVTIDKKNNAKEVVKVLEILGFKTEVTITKEIDLFAPKKELTEAQKASIEKRKKAGTYKKTNKKK